MNIKKIEKQLKKINQLFESIKEDGSISSIENDLMLSYVRSLYEKMIDSQEDDTSNNVAKSSKSKEKKEIKKAEPNQSFQDNVANAVLQEVVEADTLISTPDPIIQTTSNSTSTSFQNTAIQEVVEKPTLEIPEDLLNLFKFETTYELSDKLSRAPIQDLTKCMGINEKIFTVQELFGGDSLLFTKAMESMDKFTSLEQARDYLVEKVAVDQNWADEGRLKKAANFIKLISRRY